MVQGGGESCQGGQERGKEMKMKLTVEVIQQENGYKMTVNNGQRKYLVYPTTANKLTLAIIEATCKFFR